MLRMWRISILKNEEYNVQQNFITENCYTCIEMNAHSIVNLAIKLRNNQQECYFMPTLWSSQPCESLFRQLRSMSTTFSTVVNCSMVDVVHKIKRIQLQAEIIGDSDNNIIFPRFEKTNIESHLLNLPNNEDIFNTISKARSKY